jgi:S-DNA-T family DNA segregation ATPase FtsK/SpoIIIE
VSSPFRNPQLGLRSAITTLPEAMRKPASAEDASAATAVVAEVAVESSAVVATMASRRRPPKLRRQRRGRPRSLPHRSIHTATISDAGATATPAPTSPEADTSASPPVTFDALRDEALALLAELRELAGRPMVGDARGDDCRQRAGNPQMAAQPTRPRKTKRYWWPCRSPPLARIT